MKERVSIVSYVSAIVLLIILALLTFFLLKAPERDGREIKAHDEQGVRASQVNTHDIDRSVFELLPVKIDISDGARIDIQVSGEVYNLQLNELFINPYVLPDKDGLLLYEKLSRKAASDPVAARLLSGLLTKCKSSYIDKDQHDQSIRFLEEKYIYPAANLNRPFKVSPASIELIKEEFEQNFHQCRTISESRRKEATKWARVAAEGGDYLGLEMLTKAPDISTDERLKAYYAKWEEFGDFYSLTSLSSLLSGVGRNPPLFEDLNPDPTKAYAYFLISSKVEIAIAERNRSPELETIRYEHSVFEQLLTANLSVSEHFEAERLAQSMLEESDNCCAIDTTASYQLSIKD